MPKLVYVYGDDGRMLDTLLSSLHDNGYSAEYTTVLNESEKNRIMADIALICTPTSPCNKKVFGELSINMDSLEIVHRGHPLHFTPTEYSLFKYLINNSTRAVSRAELLSSVWGYAQDSGTRVADDTVKRLRRKLEGTGVAIETVWGYGFRIREQSVQHTARAVGE